MSEKKLTPMQYCISVIDEGINGIKAKYANVNIISIEDKARLAALESFREVMNGQLLPEQEAIKDAYNKGYEHGSDLDRGRQWEYFEDTYTTDNH